MDSNPRFVPQNTMVVSRVLDIMVGVMLFHIPAGVMTQARGVEEDDLLDLRWRAYQSRAALEQSSGSQEALWHIFSTLTSFFCVANMSVMKVPVWRSSSMDLATKTLWTHLKAMSSRRKGVIYDLDTLYSPVKRRKKYVIIIMSHPPWRRGFPKALAMIKMFLRT